MKRVFAAGLIAAIGATLLIALAASSIHVGAERHTRSSTGHPAEGGLVALLDNYDGTYYAAIARDPTFARPEVFDDRAAAAYRQQRPLFGELAWIGSLGDPSRVPMTLAVLSALSAVAAVMALGALLLRRGVSPFFALGVFAFPGVLPVVYDMMPELLQLALITAGLLLWEMKPRVHARWAIAAFTLAALTRESSLIVPLVLVAVEIPRLGSRAKRRELLPLAIPLIVYASWLVFLSARVGSSPFAARTGRLTAVPFGGLVNALQHSVYRGTTAISVVVGVIVFGGALALARRDLFYATAIGFAGMGVFLGWNVWQRPDYFGRVLLPVYAYSAIGLGVALWERNRSVTLARVPTPAEHPVS